MLEKPFPLDETGDKNYSTFIEQKGNNEYG